MNTFKGETVSSYDPEILKFKETCRSCGGSELISFLNLGEVPLVNRYLEPSQLKLDEPRFPLELMFCKTCSLSQLSVVVSPKILYSDYAYHSSISQTFQQHCREMVRDICKSRNLGKGDLVVEIASNDGCLLSKFKDAGCRVLGVEPASNLAAIAEKAGLPTINEFWSTAAAGRVVREHGNANVIVATNVLAHVDDLHGFIQLVRSTLKPEGAFVFEVPYMVNFMNRAEFDTAYHEHLSYFLLKPLKLVLEKNGMQILDVEQFDIHGGSIRVTAGLGEGKKEIPHVRQLLSLEEELGLHEERAYLRFSDHVKMLKEELVTFLAGLKSRGKSIAAYGASAKGNVLLNYCGIGKETLDYVVDDTPAKQGKFYPGNHLPIVNRGKLLNEPPDYMLLLAWNFVDELMKNTSEYKSKGGRYVVPIPSLRVM
jgi:SAM-dependent methyltransferase